MQSLVKESRKINFVFAIFGFLTLGMCEEYSFNSRGLDKKKMETILLMILFTKRQRRFTQNKNPQISTI